MKTILAGGLVSAALLAAYPAQATDLLAPAPASFVHAPSPTFYNWSGLYFGGHFGRATLDKQVTEIGPGSVENPIGSSFSLSETGDLGGLQAGHNWQPGAIVYGVETDISWTDIERFDIGLQPIGGPDDFFTGKVDWFATFRARIGYALGAWLPYVTGGAAVARLTNGYGDTFNMQPDVDSVTVRKTHTGWAYGGGLEYGFGHGWSTKVEYLYLDFGSFRASPAPPQVGVAEFEDKIEVVRFGLNYRF